MKILVLSDLHLEFHRDDGKSFINSLDNNVDLLILAGDITKSKLINYVLTLFCQQFKQVIYVHGNHEFYDSSRPEVISHTKEACENNKNLIWLDNDVTEINGIRFLGTPLWFDNRFPKSYKRMINDFSLIKNYEDWVYAENDKAVRFLRSEVREGDVVITHHLPSFRSVHSTYTNHPLNCFFVHDVEDIIRTNKPKLWIHGHTHFSFDYQLGDTRIICNPFGYLRHEQNSEFFEMKVVEL